MGKCDFRSAVEASLPGLTLSGIPAFGACGTTSDIFSSKVCEFLGAISYPVYIIHYPVMYMFYAWVWNNGITFADAWPVCMALFVVIILEAWIAMKWYDAPVRRYLSRKLLH